MTTPPRKVSTRMSMYLKVLNKHGGMTGADLNRKFPGLASRSIYRHIKAPVEQTDRRHNNPGRPRKITERDERNLLRAIKTLRKQRKSFSVKMIQEEAGLGHVTTRTIQRYLHKHGYRYCQARKKGLLTAADKVKRLKYAKEMINKPLEHWTKTIAFYFDGVGFAHKRNPNGEARVAGAMAWRLSKEGLERTSKGKKEGSGGRMANFFVGISHTHGTILCEQMETRVTGKSFANFVETHFPTAFARVDDPKCNTFLQDGDPRQNSRMAKNALANIGCQMFSIPARSPDLNPIENVFHLVRKQLASDALHREITRETYKEFCTRVKQTIENFPVNIINKTIESMPKRLKLVIAGKGNRTKY